MIVLKCKKIGLVILALLFVLTISNVVLAEHRYTSEKGYSVDISDKVDLFTDSEEDALLEKMKNIAEFGNVGVLTSDDRATYSTEHLSEQYLTEKFGAGSNSTVFVIDMYNRMIHIYSDGAMLKKITISNANTITDNVYTYAYQGDYYKTADEALGYMLKVAEGSKIAQPMKYISNILFAIAIGFLVNFCIILSTYSIKQASYEEIIGKVKTKVNISNMNVIMTRQRKTYDSSSSSSSGSGGGGGGGGHSGGGGGHRF